MNTPNDFERAAARFAERVERGPLIRAVNFHNTPRARASVFEAQLERYSRDFASRMDNLHCTGG